MANVIVKPVLTFLELWIFQMTGRGNKSIMTSVIIFIKDDHRYHALISMQWPPGRLRFQRNSKGKQMQKPATVFPIQFAISRPASVQQMMI